MSQPLVKQLPVWTEKATGKQVWALQVGRLIPCPRGVSIYPKDESYAAFEMPLWWSETTRVAEGDYVVWETGEPVFSWKPGEFEARFRPAVSDAPEYNRIPSMTKEQAVALSQKCFEATKAEVERMRNDPDYNPFLEAE